MKGDTRATAHVTPGRHDRTGGRPVDVTVPAGGSVSVTFPGVALSTPAATELRSSSRTNPAEYDIANQSRATKVEVTKTSSSPPAARLEPGWIRIPVQRAPVRADHESSARDAARPRVEGQGARAAARADLLQRQLGGERRQDPSGVGPEPGVVQGHGRAREGVGRDDRDPLSGRRFREAQSDALDGTLRRRPAGPRVRRAD